MRTGSIALFALLLLPYAAFAHPGRLDSKGCHRVTQDWQYKSGKVLKAGTYHCHRTLSQGIPLDGTQILEDPSDPGEPVKQTKEKRK